MANKRKHPPFNLYYFSELSYHYAILSRIPITKGTYEISEKNAYILLNNNTKQLVVNINQITYLTPIENDSFFINQVQLSQREKLYLPKDDLDSDKKLTRWKYRFTSKKIQKRKFDACKNRWIGNWKNT